MVEIFKLAYDQVANIEKALSGFQACSTFPFNSDKFTEDDFAPADNMKGSCLEKDVSLSSLPIDQATSRKAPQSTRRGPESPRPSTSKELLPSQKTPQNKIHKTNVSIFRVLLFFR